MAPCFPNDFPNFFITKLLPSPPAKSKREREREGEIIIIIIIAVRAKLHVPATMAILLKTTRKKRGTDFDLRGPIHRNTFSRTPWRAREPKGLLSELSAVNASTAARSPPGDLRGAARKNEPRRCEGKKLPPTEGLARGRQSGFLTHGGGRTVARPHRAKWIIRGRSVGAADRHVSTSSRSVRVG
jgi:hypothetical protein